MDVSDNKIAITNPNNNENMALEGNAKPKMCAIQTSVVGKILKINIKNAENSQSNEYFKERAFFLKKNIIKTRKITIPIIKESCKLLIAIFTFAVLAL